MARKKEPVPKKGPPLPPVSLRDAELDELLNIKPTPAIPGVYLGCMDGKQRLRSALAYHRDEKYVWTIMFSEAGGSRIVKKWSVGSFDVLFERARFPHRIGPIYTVARAIGVFLRPSAVYQDNAYRVLSKLAKGADPMEEDSLDELLDMTPSAASAVPRHNGGRRRSPADKLARRNKRKERLAAMSPVDLKAWREKRNARRKMRRLNAKKGV